MSPWFAFLLGVWVGTAVALVFVPLLTAAARRTRERKSS